MVQRKVYFAGDLVKDNHSIQFYLVLIVAAERERDETRRYVHAKNYLHFYRDCSGSVACYSGTPPRAQRGADSSPPSW